MSLISEELAAAIRADEPVALATVIDGPGAGAKLLVRPDRSPSGSLGDEGLDRVVARDVQGGLAAGSTQVRHYGPHGEARELVVSVFIQSFAAAPQMLVFGAVDFTVALVRLGKVLGYRVTVCDAREVFATLCRFPFADDVVVDWPDRLLARVGDGLTERDAVCVMTHDARFDVPALVATLRTNAGYIGAMGSRRTHADRVRRLRDAGVGEDDLHRIRAPIGLDLGSRTPEETAVSICAEIIAERNGRHVVRPLRAVKRADPRRDHVSAAAVLLAAGGGSRFTASGGTGHKLLASYRGRAVVEHAIVHAADALQLVYVVWGAIELPLPSTEADVHLVENEQWRNGIATSLQAGITRARQDGHDAVVVGLGDQPLITPGAWREVGAATDRPVAVATYDGVRGNPVRIAAPAWPLLPLAGDAGARVLMQAQPDLVVEVPCDGSALDVDTIDDLLQPSGSKDVT